jgi:hypothetical protein
MKNFKLFKYSNTNHLHKISRYKYSISKKEINDKYTFNRTLTISRPVERLKFTNKSENSNNLKKQIHDLIKAKGAISLGEYMNICLYDKSFGYYTTKEHIFGKQGDFITSPEASQIFGEIIGYWTERVLASYSYPSSFDLIEIGCGRGFLIADITRILYKINRLKGANIIMIEKSDKLAKIQQDNILSQFTKEGIFFEYKQDKLNNSDWFINKEKDIALKWYNSIDSYIKVRNQHNIKYDMKDLRLSDVPEMKGLKYLKLIQVLLFY